MGSEDNNISGLVHNFVYRLQTLSFAIIAYKMFRDFSTSDKYWSFFYTIICAA